MSKHEHSPDAVPGPGAHEAEAPKLVPQGAEGHTDLTVADNPTPKHTPVDPPSRVIPLVLHAPHDVLERHLGGPQNLILGGVYALRLVSVSQPNAPHGNVRLEFSLTLLYGPTQSEVVGIKIVPE